MGLTLPVIADQPPAPRPDTIVRKPSWLKVRAPGGQNYVQIRTIEDEELEQVWGGKKTAQEALDSVVKRGNELLERFEKANKS